jgi:CheY-like chemotaxis protein
MTTMCARPWRGCSSAAVSRYPKQPTDAPGLELIERHPPDLVLLDIRMPDIDGYEVLRRLKLNRSISIFRSSFLLPAICALKAPSSALCARRSALFGKADRVGRSAGPRSSGYLQVWF